MGSFFLLFAAILVTTARANPLANPQDVNVIGQSVIELTSEEIAARTARICGLSATDPESWQKSGAEDYLDIQLNQFGTGKMHHIPLSFTNILRLTFNPLGDWLRNLDIRSTGPGTLPSPLDCKPLGGNTCLAPSVQCPSFTPPEGKFVVTPIHEELPKKLAYFTSLFPQNRGY